MARDDYGAISVISDEEREALGLGGRGRKPDEEEGLFETIGKAGMGREQAGLDLAYQDFVRQQAFPQERLGLFSSVLRGIPVTPSQTATASPEPG